MNLESHWLIIITRFCFFETVSYVVSGLLCSLHSKKWPWALKFLLLLYKGRVMLLWAYILELVLSFHGYMSSKYWMQAVRLRQVLYLLNHSPTPMTLNLLILSFLSSGITPCVYYFVYTTLWYCALNPGLKSKAGTVSAELHPHPFMFLLSQSHLEALDGMRLEAVLLWPLLLWLQAWATLLYLLNLKTGSYFVVQTCLEF